MRRWLGVVVAGIALALSSTQGMAAESLRPTIDAGGPGAGSTSESVYYELEYEQGRPVVIQHAGADETVAPDFAVHPNLRSIQLIEGKQAVAEVARPASASAYSVCLACSTLG
jgi:hypothetical protein